MLAGVHIKGKRSTKGTYRLGALQKTVDDGF